jgi:hypothetical protein
VSKVTHFLKFNNHGKFQNKVDLGTERHKSCQWMNSSLFIPMETQFKPFNNSILASRIVMRLVNRFVATNCNGCHKTEP